MAARRTDAEAGAENAAPPPRANPDLVGHQGAERELEELYRTGRLPHAILLAGPRGIGKATLAFRFARFVLAQGDRGEGPSLLGGVGEAGLAVDPENPVFRRVAAGGHADLLTVERAWDPRRRRLRGEIVVEDAREVVGFFRLTAAEEGWRIVVIDGAEEMNRNAANAILKVLEEPPGHALLLLVSHNPGRLLPTIRSRCRRVRLAPLPQPVTAELIRRYRPQLDAAEADGLAALCGGSIGRALGLADGGGIALYRAVVELLAQVPQIDVGRLHGLADRLARAEAEDAYWATAELLAQALAALATARTPGSRPALERETVTGERAAIEALAAAAGPARWADLQAKIAGDFVAAQELNLDRKQVLLGAFFAIEETAR
ncbi:MAG TPA: DNA polymerase III subunit delta' [Stellaceae bacterium]|jgi:DNA polymerase-3 subunit delta'